MFPGIAQFQELDLHHIDHLELDHLPFPNHVIFLVLDIISLDEKLALTELHQVQYTLKLFLNNAEILDLLIFLFQR